MQAPIYIEAYQEAIGPKERGINGYAGSTSVFSVISYWQNGHLAGASSRYSSARSVATYLRKLSCLGVGSSEGIDANVITEMETRFARSTVRNTESHLAGDWVSDHAHANVLHP